MAGLEIRGRQGARDRWSGAGGGNQVYAVPDSGVVQRPLSVVGSLACSNRAEGSKAWKELAAWVRRWKPIEA